MRRAFIVLVLVVPLVGLAALASATGDVGATAVARPPFFHFVYPAGDGELRVSWTQSFDHDKTPIVTSYRIYRSSTADGTFALVEEAGRDAREWFDTGLGRSATWYYRLSAVNADGEGPLTSARGHTTWDIPGAPRDLTISSSFNTRFAVHDLSWEPPAEPTPFVTYRVYRATSPSAEPRLVYVAPQDVTTFSDGNNLPGFPYQYTVHAWNPSGEGPSSPRVCAIYPFSTPLASCR